MSSEVNTRALFSLFLKLDFRDKRSMGFKRFIGVLVAYFFANFILSYGNYRNFDETSYVILSMSTNAFFLSFIILNDFIGLFMGKDDNEIVYSLPVPRENIFFAKFFAAYSFLGFFAASIIIPQIIFYYQFESSVGSTLLFVLCVFLFNVFIISLLAMLYTIILSRMAKISQFFIYLINICFLLFVFYSSSVRVNALGEGKRTLLDYGYVNYLPQTFYAKGTYDPVTLLALLGLTIVTAGLCFYLLKLNFTRITENVSALNRKTKKKTPAEGSGITEMIDKPVIALFVRNNFQRAAYYLMKGQLANSRVFKMRYFIFLLMPLVFTAVTVFLGLGGGVVFEKGDFSAPGRISILNPTILFIYILCARLIVSNTKIADANSNDTEWIYDSLPLNSVSQVRLGVLKFILVYFLIPLVIVMGALLSAKVGLSVIAFNLLYVTSGVFLISSVLYRFDKTYPFTQDSVKMDSTGKFVEILLTIILGVFIFISQLFIFENIIFIIVAIPVLLLLGGFILRAQRTVQKKKNRGV